ncbi:protein involved in biosynthesis of mitomycin antibiotics/polyketide fumonisin [Planctomycetota bacterium]|nr:protein involved in biosynthesis of mitomycin antibiotics/polyketide fumonisin [Planctomycetota bacterium]
MISQLQPLPSPRVLTAAELAAYHRDGFHIARGVMPAAEAVAMRELYTKVSANGPVVGLSTAPKTLVDNDPLAQYPRMMHPHIHPEYPEVCAYARRWLLDARIGAILADLIGEPAVAAQSMFYFKPPGARGQDFHQDNFYLKVRPTTCIAAWIALDRTDRSNGGLSVARGSHVLPTLCPSQADHSKYFANEHVDIPPGHEVIDPVLEPGDALFFNGQVIHGSESNSSDRFRRSFICHYLPKSSTAIHKWYLPAVVDFAGNPVSFADEPGGGPCGDDGNRQPH